jgi:hypothetical protein
MELQYLNAIKHMQQHPTARSMHALKDLQVFSAFGDQSLYAGFIPSMTYLRTLYTAIIDEYRPLIDKQMMLLGGRFLKGDHSFKIIKKIAKINGTSAFTALYTVCNEYEEVRMQLLVPSKSLEHLQRSFESMRQAYDMYGYAQPEFFFTDNVRSDEKFLKNVLPSLKKNICASAANHDDLDCIDMSSIRVIVLTDLAEINRAIGILVHQDHTQPVYVGFACDNSPRFATNSCQVYIAYESRILVIVLSCAHTVPSAVVTLLESQTVIKIRRKLGADVKSLKETFNLDIRGTLEIGTFSRERGVAEHSSSSLADISAEVLSRRLPTCNDYLSHGWPILEADIIPAVNRALCSLQVFKMIQHKDVIGRHLYGEPSAGTNIALFAPDTSTPAAFGSVVGTIGTSRSNTSRKVEIRVTKVLVPAMILCLHDSPLEDFGAPPFIITVHQSHLRTWSSYEIGGEPQDSTQGASNGSNESSMVWSNYDGSSEEGESVDSETEDEVDT